MVKLLTVEKGASLNRLSIVNMVFFLSNIEFFDITTYRTSIVLFGADLRTGILFYLCLLYNFFDLPPNAVIANFQCNMLLLLCNHF